MLSLTVGMASKSKAADDGCAAGFGFEGAGFVPKSKSNPPPKLLFCASSFFLSPNKSKKSVYSAGFGYSWAGDFAFPSLSKSLPIE